MELAIIFIGSFLINSIQCYDSESSEANRIEVNPVYDTIIFSDIADIINEFGNNVRSPFDALINSGSESDENIEDLLSEYQHYLDKAHKQRKNYMEKSKLKNKIPLIRHEKYSKTKSSAGGKYNDYFYADGYYNSNTFKFPQPYNNPLDLFIPIKPNDKYLSKPELATFPPKENHKLDTFEKIILSEKDSPISPYPNAHIQIKTCYCKNGRIPSDFNCKQCVMPLETLPQNHFEQQLSQTPEEEKKTIRQNPLFNYNLFKNSNSLTDDKFGETPDNTVNIHIKVDVRLPKLLDDMGKYYRFQNHDKPFDFEDDNSKELASAINLPLSYLNFPVPMNLFGYKKASKLSKTDASPFHKITIHKKKKSKLNNSNKKHRKKVITFHNIKLEPQQLFEANFGDNNTGDTYKTVNDSHRMVSTDLQPNITHDTEFNVTNNVTEKKFINGTQTEENIILMVNITKNFENGTDDYHKIENSIETELTTNFLNVTEIPIARIKREISSINKSIGIQKEVHDSTSNLTQVKNIDVSALVKDKTDSKKSDKSLVGDNELLYWPYNSGNQTQTNKKNITSIILESENKKAKLNMTKEAIRHNHTRALEQAIFGDVNWNDIGTIAPAFMSFVGKYITGVLTFCSESICHSMNCREKICLHRTCAPIDRINNKGHCVGSNTTDSVASMESIMDLPSNIVSEIVDILQDKMLGKLFGKVTLCISTKCISFATSKKMFVINKCSTKELNTVGHCLNTKNIKNL